MENRVPIRELQLFYGRHKRLSLHVRRPNGQDLDLTGATVEFGMSRRAGGTSVLSIPGVVTNGPTGRAQVDILDTDLDPLPNKNGDFEYEIVVTDLAGRESPVIRGPVEFNASIVTT